jgi:sec-independent protein translocase protein TatB
MFNIGFSEFVIIGILALIFIGPKQLPDLARALGRMISDFQRASDDVKKSLMEVRDESVGPVLEIRDEIRKDLHQATSGFDDYMTEIKTAATADVETSTPKISEPKISEQQLPEQLDLLADSADESQKHEVKKPT